MIMHRIKLFTHEAIVHTQINTLERILDRKIEFEIVLNTKGLRSSLELSATQHEIEMIRSGTSYTILVRSNDAWMPVI
jgi:hypothetical protein